MKITVFNGSPAASKSNSNVIASALLDGAKAGGAQIDNVFLIEKNIRHCSGCFSCWFKTPGKCIYNDDMTELIEKYISSDIICFATPVYTWDMTACLKNFADRLIPLRSPMITHNNERFDMKVKYKMPDVVVLSNCGFPGDNNFDIIKHVFSTINPILEIYRNCGKLLQIDNENVKPIVNEYLEYVKLAGKELAEKGSVNQSTKENLDMQLMDTQDYLIMLGIG